MKIRFICDICKEEITSDEMFVKVKLPMPNILGRADRITKDVGQTFHIECLKNALASE